LAARRAVRTVECWAERTAATKAAHLVGKMVGHLAVQKVVPLVCCWVALMAENLVECWAGRSDDWWAALTVANSVETTVAWLAEYSAGQ